jgi:radical SAM superfamily enzyme YgiQ (UPF0313 family)
MQVTPGLLVVRTSNGWFATPPSGRDPIPLPFQSVLALVAASTGEHVPADLPQLESLVAAGVLVEAPSDDAHAVLSPWSAATSGRWVAPVPDEAWIWPAGATLGRIIAGSLQVEGDHGKQALLDHIDLALLDLMSDVDGMLAGSITAAAEHRFAALPRSELDLARRLGRLADVGCIRWYPDTMAVVDAPASSVAAEAATADAHDGHAAPDGPDDDEAAAPGTELAPSEPPAPTAPLRLGDLRAVASRLRHQPFPGRDRLKAEYRRRRPLGAQADEPALATIEPVAPAPVVATAAERPPVEAAPEAAPTDAADSPAAPAPLYIDSPRVGPAVAGRIPVYSPFVVGIGPPLSLGMLTANARHAHDGALNEHFEIRRTEDAESLLDDLAGRTGPAIVLCSNYLWSYAHNLEVARRAVAINPETIFVHGGPHTPTYADDCRQFFDEHPDLVHVTARGEGEQAIVDILTALASGLPALDLRQLEHVTGISYRHPDGEIVATEDRDRIAELDRLPSPYLTGEFDHLTSAAFAEYVTFESNRGCPYGCTFCDWGSMTLSRIRMFDLGRVQQEMTWAGERGLEAWVLADANLGIMSRDVDLVKDMVKVREQWGVPRYLGFNVAKNTTKHLTAIVDRLVDAGVATHVSLALQTNDAATLEAVRRTNINTDHYVALGASFRRSGLPLQADLMLGLPGQSVDSFSRDLQFLMEHDIPARVWVTQLLPNSPMNDPEYRAEFAIEADDDGLVISSSTFSVDDRLEMKRIRHAHAVFERFGMLRHISRYLQWDHGVEMIRVLRRAVELSQDDPTRYPLINWTLRYFDQFNIPPMGWHSFYLEVRRFIATEFGVTATPTLDTVFALQEFLMPVTGRQFPDTIALDHDYLAYHREATASLWTTGAYAAPARRLADFGPARFTIYGDRLDRCGKGMRVVVDPRSDRVTDEFWMSGHMELDSPLVVSYADIAGSRQFLGLIEQLEFASSTSEPVPEDEAVPVKLGERPARRPSSNR